MATPRDHVALSPMQAAAWLGTSPKRIRALLDTGALHGERCGRWHRRVTIAELEKYQRQQDRETKRLGALVHINDLLVGPI